MGGRGRAPTADKGDGVRGEALGVAACAVGAPGLVDWPGGIKVEVLRVE